MKNGLDCIGITVVFFCHDGDGNFVMGLRGDNARDEQGKWDIGGGGVEFGESVEDTLKREIKEEYGTEVLACEFLGFRDVQRLSGNNLTHWIALDFKALVDPQKVKNSEPHKIEKVEWFKLDDLPSPIHSQLQLFLEKYKNKL